MRIQIKRRVIRTVSVFLLVNMAFQLVAPLSAYALTSGPSTPEVQSFTPAGTTDMVDLFTGNFGYNLPVFELPGPNGGYPFNLSYTGGVTMDQEASWVGLGWNLGPGSVNREVRGLPDDFDGDIVKYRHDMLKNSTVGINVGFDVELLGASMSKAQTKSKAKGVDISIGLNLYYNTYRGFGLSLEPGVGYHISNTNKTNAAVGLKMTMDSQEGVGVNPTLSLSGKADANGKTHESFSIGVGYNSKRGLTGLNYSYGSTSGNAINSYLEANENKKQKYNVGSILGGHISFAHAAYTPSIDMEMRGYNLSFTFKAGGEVPFVYLNGMINGYYTEQTVNNANVDVGRRAYGYLSAEHVSDLTEGSVLDFNREKDGLVRRETPNLAIPSMTHDLYSMSGQGISGSFRPYRPQVSTLFDPYSKSLVGGLSAGVDLGFGEAFHWGAELSGNVSKTTVDESRDPEIVGAGGFRKENFTASSAYDNTANTNLNNLVNDYERYYFKATGEPTTEKKSRYDYMGGDALIDLSSSSHGFTEGRDQSIRKRKPRNQSIQPYKNSDLNSSNYLPEFYNTYYYDGLGDANSQRLTRLDRGVRAAQNPNFNHHIGGYSVLQPDGSRYVFGLPVYNTKQVDKQYSVTSIDQSTGHAWAPDISGTESGSIPYMLPAANEDNNFHKVPFNFSSGSNSGDYNINSQCYLNRSEIPPYTTSHLITCILGADYVDVDNNGPSDNDFGYWVKFNYVKVPQYNWKAPYLGVNYSKGGLYSGKDDKASYIYGEKEVYYLHSAETKTHIAIFDISERRDAAGIPGQFRDQADPNGQSAAKSFKLNKIRLYSKLEYKDQSGNINTNAQPISTANFEYSYELCQGIPNFIHPGTANDPSTEGVLASDIVGEDGTPHAAGTARPGTGKLTLKKVWFTYERSNRGALTPYQFNYNGNDPNCNPSYEHKNQDRWGVYKDVVGRGEYDYPYSTQDKSNPSGGADKTDIDRNARAWCLSTITTPSGSRIKVSYESDDYAYVQNKIAGQMFKIARTYIEEPHSDGMAKLYTASTHDAGPCRKVYFDLQGEQYPATLSEDHASFVPSTGFQKNKQILWKYISDLQNPDGKYQLYYKVKMDMRSQDEPIQEYISGYAEFNPANTQGQGIGFDRNCVNANGIITRGYIYLDMPYLGATQRDFHPFSAAAWNFLRTNMSELASDPGKLGTPAGQSMSVKDKALEVASSVVGIRDLFTTYYGRASRHVWASRIDVNHSFIRLCTPYKKKYGGGHRVSKIVIESDWDKDYEGQKDAGGNPVPTQYGVTYDYKDYNNPVKDDQGNIVKDANGDKVYWSSGVAQYEPSIGGDEISLRFARSYPEHIPLKTDNNLYFEYPVNEGYYPGATVGYSMVTVRSLATDNQVKNSALTTPSIALAGMAGTGETVHEFYTAKDFPVITDATPIAMDPQDVYVPIPFIGEVKLDNLKSHQGYKVEVNDMHGKPKRVSYYRQKADGSVDKSNPVSYVEYTYQEGPSTTQNNNPARTISSAVNVMTGEGVKSQSSDNYELGAEYDCFMDIRHAATRSGTGGLSINSDLTFIGPIPIPAFCPWPNISYSQTEVDLGVTNKIIRRTGILTETKAYDGNSLVTTDNLYYDAQTGRPVLTTVTNDFDAPIYKYSIPAYWLYDGMGAAYKNFGLVMTASATTTQASGQEAEVLLTVPDNSLFVEGDEFICNGYKGTVQRKNNANGVASLDCTLFGSSSTPFLSGNVDLRIIRSGRRNMLTNDAGNITALQDPTVRKVANNLSCTTALSTDANQMHVEINPNFILVLKIINALCSHSTQITGTHTWNELYDASGQPYNPPRYEDHNINGSNTDPQPDLYKMSFNQFNDQSLPYYSLVSSALSASPSSLNHDDPYDATAYSFSPAKMPVSSADLYILNYSGTGGYLNSTQDASTIVGPFQPLWSNQAVLNQYSIPFTFPFGSLVRATAWDISYVGFPHDDYFWPAIDNGYESGGSSLRYSYAEPQVMPYLAGPPLPVDPLGNVNPPVAGNANPANAGRIVNWGGPIGSGQKQLINVGTHYSTPPQSTANDDIIMYNTQVGNPDNQNVFIKFTYRDNSTGETSWTWVSAAKAWGYIPATRTVGGDHSDHYGCSNTTVPNTIDTVLSATAVKYRDTWVQDFSQYRGDNVLTTMVNKYNTGELGTWRPYESYTYVDDRGQGLSMASAKLTDNNNTATKVNLKRDGSFNSVPVFDWFNPSFISCFPKWRLTNTITAYNPYGYESENMDILHNYSAALYGYDGKLPIAVASNTTNQEGAFEGFEEYKGNPNSVSMSQRTTGNFTFVNNMNTSTTQYKKFKVAFGYGNTAAIDMDYNDFVTQYGGFINGNVQISAEAAPDPSQSPAWPYESIVATSANTTVGTGTLVTSPTNTNSNAVMLQFTAPGGKPSGTAIPDFQYGQMSRCWTGYVYLPVAVTKQASYPNISFVTDRAHTGKVSMKVTGTSEIPQLDLSLLPDKKYVLGAWISSDKLKSMPVAALQAFMQLTGWGIKIGYGTVGGSPTTWYPVNTIKSKFIDGWVRIEDENFTTPSSLPAGSILYIRFEGLGGSPSDATYYVDDIRLHPYDGNMKSYVYDLQNYKLRAELDNNNYATLYSYDAQGNLFQIRRETEEGILTVQESRSHIKQ